MESGIHAIGGIGLRSSIRGKTARCNLENAPKARPRAMPEREAMAKPARTRRRLALRSSKRIPLAKRSTRAARATEGEGTRLFLKTAPEYSQMRRAAITAASCSRSHSGTTAASGVTTCTGNFANGGVSPACASKIKEPRRKQRIQNSRSCRSSIPQLLIIRWRRKRQGIDPERFNAAQWHKTPQEDRKRLFTRLQLRLRRAELFHNSDLIYRSALNCATVVHTEKDENTRTENWHL
jgi:hypothetical protein